MVGPVYKISCEECYSTCVREIEHTLRARFGEHRRPSSSISEVSKHIHMDSPNFGEHKDIVHGTQMV